MSFTPLFVNNIIGFTEIFHKHRELPASSTNTLYACLPYRRISPTHTLASIHLIYFRILDALVGPVELASLDDNFCCMGAIVVFVPRRLWPSPAINLLLSLLLLPLFAVVNICFCYRCVVSYPVMLCYVMLCYIVLCYVILFCSPCGEYELELDDPYDRSVAVSLLQIVASHRTIICTSATYEKGKREVR